MFAAFNAYGTGTVKPPPTPQSPTPAPVTGPRVTQQAPPPNLQGSNFETQEDYFNPVLFAEPVAGVQVTPEAVGTPDVRPKLWFAETIPFKRENSPPPTSSAYDVTRQTETSSVADVFQRTDDMGPDDVFGEEVDEVPELEDANAAQRKSRTTVGYLDKSQYYQFSSHSFVSRLDKASQQPNAATTAPPAASTAASHAETAGDTAASGHTAAATYTAAAAADPAEATPAESARPPISGGGTNKGGRNKSSRGKSSETASGKLKSAMGYDGAMTRRRERKRREEEESVRSGLNKLLDAGRKLTEEDAAVDDSDEDLHLLSRPTGDFSGTDLIRSNIANPSSFDTVPQPVNASDDVVIVSHDANANLQSSVTDNLSSRWNFSLNPFAYLQRSDQEENAGGETQATNRPSSALGSITDDAVAAPQCSSTPTNDQPP